MIRVAWGVGTAETPLASFDTALAAAGAHEYNLRELSSVIPAGVAIESPGRLPDLGPAGSALDVVLARQTSPPGEPAAAGLAWVRDPAPGTDTDTDTDTGTDEQVGAGTFYEEEGTDPARVRERLRSGIAHGARLRNISGAEPVFRLVDSGSTSGDKYTTAVVIAVYGHGESLLGESTTDRRSD